MGEPQHRSAKTKGQVRCKKGMSSNNKREADKIIRETQKGTQKNFQIPQLQMQPFAPMTPMGMPFPMGPLGFPPPQYPQFPHQNQHLLVQTRGNNGPCFNCNHSGHVARNCPMSQRNSRGGGNSGRGNHGKRFFGKKRG